MSDSVETPERTDERYLPPMFQYELGNGQVLLKDGSSALLRTATEDDHALVVDLLESISDESRYSRFFSGGRDPEKLADEIMRVGDPEEEITLLVIKGKPGERRAVGMGSYIRLEDQSGTAEPAFLVRDDYQNRGIGTLLLERLALIAAKNGITEFEAYTLPDNRKMKEVFERSGFPVSTSMDDKTFKITFPIEPNREMVKQSEFRDRIATVASLKPFFEPESVAVIGASREPDSVGHRVLKALIDSNFNGDIYPVNPKTDTLLDLDCYESVSSLDHPVDLGIVAVPADSVDEVLEDCHERLIHSLVVITAGFSETGEEGLKRQQALQEKIFGYGMRMIGPNCLGLINTDPEIRLNASFSPTFPPDGNVAIASQSGALGLAILDYSTRQGLGFSSFVSIGNKIDVSGNDLIQYWAEDDRTEVILLYLESFGNPRRFAQLTKKIGTKKPIVIVKGGRSEAGRKAASSHTAALTSPDIATEALFNQAGVIGVDTLEEMFNTASFLSSQPLPEGSGVAIVTNSGGPGILCADACEKQELDLAEFREETIEELESVLPSSASLTNPVDMIATAGPEEYRKTIEILHRDPNVDTLVVIYTPLELNPDEEIARAVEDGIRTGRETSDRKIPVSGVFFQPESECNRIEIDGEKIPVYRFPESAAQALGRAYRYRQWRKDIENYVPRIPGFDNMDLEKAASICQRSAGSEPKWLGLTETIDLLEAVGIKVAPTRLTRSADEAATVAEEFGYPVVLKMASKTLIHKSEWDGVKLNLQTEQELRNAYESIEQTLREAGKLGELDGIAVQPHIRDGLELMTGMSEDDVFGPLITFGLGGIHVEILEDVSVRITPLTNYDVNKMLDEIKGRKLLDGYRGSPSADKDALRELLLRLSQLVEGVPEIEEMDLNPLKAFQPGEGYAVLDARILVQETNQK